ncbi:MAG TPA: RsmG family class I SAM-dependent methyltransferase, partial [Beijerinckiaceae bacterium]|nr:RsmG family class I SAM-dependent methyltransferase [Beijerinckiaceae bacterium]
MAEPAGRRAVVADQNVSRETLDKLDILVDELGRWQTIKNLIGPGTLAEIWTRHIADSLQLLAIEPQALRWADLGS